MKNSGKLAYSWAGALWIFRLLELLVNNQIFLATLWFVIVPLSAMLMYFILEKVFE